MPVTLFSVARCLEHADRVLSLPPKKAHMVRPELRGERVFLLVLPLHLCLTGNPRGKQLAWQHEKTKAAAWNFITVQAFRQSVPREPLEGRPQVIATRFSVRAPDAYSDWAKVGVDLLTRPKGKHMRGLNLLTDDGPDHIELIQRWEPGPRSGGFVTIEVRA